ncbi:MAG: M14 family metallopeptidase [Balneolaceae bacterium]|nr:M14 family metallopeptidase [Balneolaceae bacterium]
MDCLKKLIFTALFSVTVYVAAYAQDGPFSDYEFRYHTYDETVAMLNELAEDYPQLVELYSIGKTATGQREMWMMEITNKNTGPASSKPGAYFDGNQHDNEVMGGEVATFLPYYLLTQYGKSEEITRLLDTRVLYILPLANPDGAEAYITGRVDWDPMAIDNADRLYDRGENGNDGPEDLDGDGEILKMRVENPDGDWKTYDKDPRIMVRREEGDSTGTFYDLYDEGIDSDEDGEINNDPPHTRFITNRNYPGHWSSDDGKYRGAGDYPLDEKNSRNIVEFIVHHPNIAMIESYHTTSGVHLRPFSARPTKDLPRKDLQDYTAILAMGTEITTYPQASIYHEFTTIDPELSPEEQPGTRHGVFVDWGYLHHGIFSTTTELWTMEDFVNEVGWGEIPRDKPLFAIPGRYRRPDVQAKVLQWLDEQEGAPELSGQKYVDWKAYNHPSLGKVELGGFTKYWLRNPPPGPYFKKVAIDQAEFAMRRGLLTPLVKIRDVNVSPTDENTWTVRAKIVNEGYLDTSMEQARLIGRSKPVELSIKGNDDSDYTVHTFPFLRGTRGSGFESFYYGEWEIEAPKGSEMIITLWSKKGGHDEKSVVLK